VSDLHPVFWVILSVFFPPLDLYLLLFGRVILPHFLLKYFLPSHSFLFSFSSMLWGACLCFGLLQELQPNRILLITIHNPLYPITVDVLHQVFSPHGFVEKIVTFQKSAGQLSILFLLFISLSAPHFCPCLALLLIVQPQVGTPT
jgi:hypothetical protein